MSAVLWPVTSRITAALNAVNGSGEHERAMRLLKVSEEAGEAAAAYIGMTGQNPRKGTTHTPADVADELCDVIIAAAVALHAFTTTPHTVLDAKLHTAALRLNTSAPEQAYATAPDLRSEAEWIARTLDTAECFTALEREYYLRKAAVLDRIALLDEPDTPGTATETATAAALFLIDTDQADVISDPRGYVRRQYTHWARNN